MPTVLSTYDVHATAGVLLPHGIRAPTGLLLTTATKVLIQDLGNGNVKTLGEGYKHLRGIIATPDAKGALLVEEEPRKRFSLYSIKLDKANRGDAQLLLDRQDGVPTQLVLLNNRLWYPNTVKGTIMQYDFDTKQLTTLYSELVSPTGLALSGNGKTLMVTEYSNGRVVCFNVATGARSIGPQNLSGPQLLTKALNANGLLSGTGIVICEDLQDGRVRLWTPPLFTLRTFISPTPAGKPLVAWQIGPKLIVIDAGRVIWVDIQDRLTVPPRIFLAERKPFIGTFQRVHFDFGNTGLAFKDVDFRIPDGSTAGIVSLCLDDLSTGNEVMLLVGDARGPHNIEMVKKGTNEVLAKATYEITNEWTDPKAGPSRWHRGNGVHPFRSFHPTAVFWKAPTPSPNVSYIWGNGSGPSPITAPQLPNVHVCIVTLDTSDSKYVDDNERATARNDMVTALTGSTPSPDGKIRSTAAYFKEVTYGNTTLDVDPTAVSLTLTTTLADNLPGTDTGRVPGDATALGQACLTEAKSKGVNFDVVNTILIVMRSQVDLFCWPCMSAFTFAKADGSSVVVRVVFMPHDWPLRDGRGNYQTLSHEFGHVVGLPDLYLGGDIAADPFWSERTMQGFDLMEDRGGTVPHFCVPSKMIGGWMKPGSVLPLDFSDPTTAKQLQVELRAQELGSDGTQVLAAEVLIEKGRSFFFEYRKTQPKQIADQLLSSGGPKDTADGVVVGTEVIVPGVYTANVQRPVIMRLPTDPDGEIGFYGVGQDYKDVDVDNTGQPTAEFRMKVLERNDVRAKIEISYGINGKPELYISPPSPNTWQSPDIEVQNARSDAQPDLYFNVPWRGHLNKIVARFRNSGPITAKDVTVRFYALDFTNSASKASLIGTATLDVPPETVKPYTEFMISWFPEAIDSEYGGDAGHTCIIVRADRYQDTSVNPNIVELNDDNNATQSNYVRFIASNASPSRRGVFSVAMKNPYPVNAQVHVMPVVQGTFAAFYRVYLEHTSLLLKPHETRQVQVLLESLYGNPEVAAITEKYGRRFFQDVNVLLCGFIRDPYTKAQKMMGGAQVRLGSGRSTAFETFDVKRIPILKLLPASEHEDDPKADAKSDSSYSAVSHVSSDQKEYGTPGPITYRPGNYDKTVDAIVGRVIVLPGASTPAVGFVLLTFHGVTYTQNHTYKVPLDENGRFMFHSYHQVAASLKANFVTCHYPGIPGLAPCDAPNKIKA